MALVTYAARIVGCRMRAEDVVQEAYFRFTSGSEAQLNRPGGIAQPVGYLYRIVRNLAVDWTRRRSSEETGGLNDNDLNAVPASSPSPEQEALHRQELLRVAVTLDTLPPRTRRAFEMHRLGGHTLQEVATELGVSVTLAHQLVRTALTRCAASLETAHCEVPNGSVRKNSSQRHEKLDAQLVTTDENKNHY